MNPQKILLDKNGLDENGHWPMTKEQYAKIHPDYKGCIYDDEQSALKCINGATRLVIVKIIK